MKTIFLGLCNHSIEEIGHFKHVSPLWNIDSSKYASFSVEQAMVALTYADRFGMMHLHKRVLPYLKGQSFPKEKLDHTFELCSRFYDNTDLIVGNIHLDLYSIKYL